MGARPRLIRFVVSRKHWRSGVRSGLFQAIDEILDGEDAPVHLRPALLELARWFNEHLPTPFRSEPMRVLPRSQRAARATDQKIDPQARALSWIKDSATEHVTRLYHLKALIEEAGWLIDEISTAKPGEVLYEDEFQIIAIPFADTPT